MKLADQHSFLSFIKNWTRERDVMTPQEIDELMIELARSYYSALSRYSELVGQIQLAIHKNAIESDNKRS